MPKPSDTIVTSAPAPRQCVDERTSAGIEGNLVDDGRDARQVLRQQLPFVDQALTAPDLAATVGVADRPPLGRCEALEHVHAGVGRGDRAVEVEEHGGVRKIEGRRHAPMLRPPARTHRLGAMAPVPVAIVPHTHWDREWYAPFQSFRVKLVRLLDELLDLLESDPHYRRFLLDGQTVVIDDYLAVRPDAAARLAALAAAGRLQVGPWMVLMDEFMVSGETIVRDLQLGIARATELGAVMDVGYLPDMFGHVAQMPQLLRLAGFEHAVVWRGVPESIERTAFWWAAPDGSSVRAEYLYGSYSNGRDLPPDAAGLVQRARGYDAELGAARLTGGGILLMNGTDHQLPQPWLSNVVTAANTAQSDYQFAIRSLPEYLHDQPSPPDLPVWTGELRSARARTC